jgi:hypothetical protein
VLFRPRKLEPAQGREGTWDHTPRDPAGIPRISEHEPPQGLKSTDHLSVDVARLRSTNAPDSLVLFVAGEPDTMPSVRQSTVGFGMRFGGQLLGGPVYLPKNLRPTGTEPQPGPNELEDPTHAGPRAWHLPPSQMHCLQIVLDSAKRLQREVLVVDVDQPGELEDLVRRWVGPEDVLPLLVRPDGKRLEGQERFDPARVRQFIAGT